MFRPLHEALLAAFEGRLNALLQRDESSLERIRRHAGQTLALHIQGLPSAYITLTSVGLRLQQEFTGQADTEVHTSLATLMANLAEQRPAAASGMRIDGNLALPETLQQVALQLDPDWEGWAAEFIGDVPAHALGTTLAKGWQWLQRSRGDLHLDVQEYLQEEIRLLPSRLEIDDWIDDLHHTQLQLDRLEARLARLT
ncbi:SCP2 sterol-binding domain-containing protein [Pokkaliibacter sp. MBI-7]|uniref:ubiquinone biosynthesis accessory factor UbiJ n=1 Tax=Pokkaliibacter sp. MBI-7 TaxID=3040600 RepID=UPI00244860C4|nr:SCP2 sterol-binding domain-containing protein [Pokkaliibacter sp. MBI-7]MDH2433599.1 SCP2 sterol-binding domain-containing protein [Pokkaliibacter sp. MBI-7]